MDEFPAEQVNPTIRAATEDDCKQIGVYGAELVALHHAWDSRRFIASGPQTPDKYAGFLATQLGRNGVVVLVAEEDGVVVAYSYGAVEGYDYMVLRGPAGVVYDIFVDVGSRGRGLGRQLLDATVEALATLGATQIVLSTAHVNEAGKRLFQSAGFRPTMVEMTLQTQEKPD